VKLRTDKQESRIIVYDADSVPQPTAELFDPGYWEVRGALAATARGRGSAYVLDTPFGAAVLKQYLRGGWPARISRDQYLFTGFQRSRPLAELRVLALLAEMGLPAPAPLGALCERRGAFYRGWLLTRLIAGAQPLSEILETAATGTWRETGKVIRRFHDAGVAHADLNGRNILADHNGAIYLVDFDRARVSVRNNGSFRANLNRLRRSLEKLWPPRTAVGLDDAWKALLAGYAQGVA